MSVSVSLFTASDRNEWDSFVASARNGLFLFARNYLEYHNDRFSDHSLLFRLGGRLIGVLPGNLEGQVLHSHGGLTFGGVVVNERCVASHTIAIFDALLDHAERMQIRKLRYKPVPFIFQRQPAEEDLFAINLLGGMLVRRDIASVVDLRAGLRISKSKRQGRSRGLAAGLDVQESRDLPQFFALLTHVLRSRHDARPTHTEEELTHLQSKFPDSIKLFVAAAGGTIEAGAIVYDYESAVHTQYLAASDRGRTIGALDLLITELGRSVFSDRRYLSLGTSMTGARTLNMSLLQQKEMLGARAVVFDQYELDMSRRALA